MALNNTCNLQDNLLEVKVALNYYEQLKLQKQQQN